MTNPVIWIKRELRDILNFRKFKAGFDSLNMDIIDFEQLYKLADGEIKPIQIKSEITALIEYLNEFQPKLYCEIGLANGGTCFLISNSIKSLKKVYGIDLHIFNKRLQKYFAANLDKLKFKTGDSTDQKIISWLKNELGSQKLDVLFIDGDHSYKGVKEDFRNYHQLVRENGLIVFHDIIPDHGQKYGIETNRNTGGVPKFYSEISSHFPSKEIVENEDQDGFGIGVIHYSNESFNKWVTDSCNSDSIT